MDGRRFDDLARSLATRRNRRGFLAGLVGSVAGLTMGARTDAACPPGQVNRRGMGCVCKATGRPPDADGCPCRSNEHRCGDICTQTPCACLPDVCPTQGVCRRGECCIPVCDGKQCGDDGCRGTCGECADGQRCDGGQCVCDATSCPVGCCDSNGNCQGGDTNEACGTGGADCDVCTGDEVCGVTTPGVCEIPCTEDCSTLDGPCATGVCDTSTGNCVAQPANGGASCPHSAPCTTGGVCAAGVCQGVAVICDSPGPCQTGAGVCNPSTNRCEYPSATDYSPCSDNNFCCGGVCCGDDEISCQGGFCSGLCVGGGDPCPPDSLACCSASCDRDTGLCRPPG